jgi:MFS family permease
MTAIENSAPCTSAVPRARSRFALSPMTTFVGTVLAFVGITFAAGAPSPLFVLLQQEWAFPSWMLSLAFAIYAITLLLTLLVAGSLSDHIGRRPLLIGAMVVEIASMMLFIVAPNIGWIIAARAIQGIATGAATSTFSATIVEYAPERFKRAGALIASVAPVGGLALGALATGFAVQFTTVPSLIVFGFLAVLFVAGALVVIASPETVTRRPGALASLIPRLSIPRAARRDFAASLPVFISTWMLAGLFLGLAPSIIRGIFDIDSGLVNGIVVALQPAAGAVAAVAFGRVAPRKVIPLATLAVIAGIALVLIAVSAHVFPLMFVGAIVGGSGFGAAFSASLRTLAPLAEPHERAELFSAIYLVNYLSYGAPALVAGELIGVVGLEPTVIGYAIVTLLIATVGLFVRRAALRPLTAAVSD